MPLIIISGYPSSGKTHRARQLVEYFSSKISAAANKESKDATDAQTARLRIHHISDQTLGLRPDVVFREARTEKDARAAQFSAVERALGRDEMVIADGLNYIKGFRYQLYCAAKAAGTPSCVIHVGTPIFTCREINARSLQQAESNATTTTTTTTNTNTSSVNGSSPGYPEHIFENLIYRYEEPNGMNRWDKPLFTVLHDDPAPPFDDIWKVLVAGNPKTGGGITTTTVKPNQSTVLSPPTSSTHLYDLDRLTQEIISLIQTHQTDHPGELGGRIPLTSTTTTDDDDGVIHLPVAPAPLSVSQLQRLRRQFITLNRHHLLNVNDPHRLKILFVDYLNDHFSSC